MHKLMFKLKFGVPVCRREALESQSTGGAQSLPFSMLTPPICVSKIYRVFF